MFAVNDFTIFENKKLCKNCLKIFKMRKLDFVNCDFNPFKSEQKTN